MESPPGQRRESVQQCREPVYSIDNRFTNLDLRFDTLTGKVVDIDNQLTRVEAILERH
jgi:hypothetical protein